MLVDDMRWYLLCKRNSVPEEVTGAELICFHLIPSDSGEMRLHISLCMCARVCVVIVDLGRHCYGERLPRSGH